MNIANLVGFGIPKEEVVRGTVSTGAEQSTIAVPLEEKMKQTVEKNSWPLPEAFPVLTEFTEEDKVDYPADPWNKVHVKPIDFFVPDNQTQLHTNNPETFWDVHLAEKGRFFNRAEVKTSKAMVYVSVSRATEDVKGVNPRKMPGDCKLAVRAYNPHPTNRITVQMPRYGYRNRSGVAGYTTECDVWIDFWKNGGRQAVSIGPKQSEFLFIEEVNEKYVELMASLDITGDGLAEGSGTKCVIAIYFTWDVTKIPSECQSCTASKGQYSGTTNRFYFRPKEPLSIQVSECLKWDEKHTRNEQTCSKAYQCIGPCTAEEGDITVKEIPFQVGPEDAEKRKVLFENTVVYMLGKDELSGNKNETGRVLMAQGITQYKKDDDGKEEDNDKEEREQVAIEACTFRKREIDPDTILYLVPAAYSNTGNFAVIYAFEVRLHNDTADSYEIEGSFLSNPDSFAVGVRSGSSVAAYFLGVNGAAKIDGTDKKPDRWRFVRTELGPGEKRTLIFECGILSKGSTTGLLCWKAIKRGGN